MIRSVIVAVQYFEVHLYDARIYHQKREAPHFAAPLFLMMCDAYCIFMRSCLALAFVFLVFIGLGTTRAGLYGEKSPHFAS